MVKQSSELLTLAEERVKEKFPGVKVDMISAYWSDLREFPCNDVAGVYRCSLYIDDRLAFGYGKTMNECIDRLLKNSRSELERIWSNVDVAIWL